MRIHQVAVVRQRHHALVRLHHDGLGIEQRRVSGGGIAGVADGQGSPQFGQHFFQKNVGDQAHGLVHVQGHAVRSHNAGRLLAAMLQRMQAEVGKLFGFGMSVDCDYAALVVKFVGAFSS